MKYGIKPNNQGYVDFVIPKGLNFDYRYFNESGMSVEYKGEYIVNIPMAKGLYLVVGKIMIHGMLILWNNLKNKSIIDIIKNNMKFIKVQTRRDI